MLTSILAWVAAAAVQPIPAQPVDTPWWFQRHESNLRQTHTEKPNVLFLGDSITDLWRNEGHTIWDSRIAPLAALNFGIGGDRVEHVLWRVRNGELEGISPRVIVLLIGTNNLPGNEVGEILATHAELLTEIRGHQPQAKILLLGVFPRVDDWSVDFRPKVVTLNTSLRNLASEYQITFLDIGERFKSPDGGVSKEVMHDGLHLTEKGYGIWADAMLPVVRDLLH